VTLSFDEALGRGERPSCGFGIPGRRGALGKSMTSYERRPDYVELKPTWKGNLGWLLFIATIVSAGIFVFVTK
jgi:hypothetical protein